MTNTFADCPGNFISKITAHFAFPSPVTPGSVLFNEIMNSVPTGGAEFGELYNPTEKIYDLSTLRISCIDLETGVPNGFEQLSDGCYLFFPDDYIVLTDNPDYIKNNYVIENTDAFLQMNFPDLLTDGDMIVLQDNLGTTIDSLRFYSSWHFPLLNDVHGISLERLSSSRLTNDYTNWHSAAGSAGFATPGYRNSQYDDGGSGSADVTVEPEIFSPDNDGKNDVVNILFHFTTPGYLANIKVFDSKGRSIRTLVENELLGNDGTLSWDGINDDKEKARTGIYVFYIEVFNTNGDVKKYKKTCVLATRL